MRQAPASFAMLLLAVAVGQAYAQTTPTDVIKDDDKKGAAAKLETLTITTGTRSAKAVDKIPGAVTVISTQEVQQSLVVTEDATAVLARTVPGYSESTQALSNTGENLRGRIALRLFDGIPQGSPLREGTRNGTFTDMGVIGRIEVINGPSASEGIGAAGGIINYISKNPSKPGDEFTLTTKYTTQFHDDSSGFKVGGLYTHKEDMWDLLAAVSHVDRGITYDGHGRRIGPNTSGSLADSKSNDGFVKLGTDFGDARAQRVQVSLSKFRLKGNGSYHLVDGDRTTGVTNTAEHPGDFGALSEVNDFLQGSVSYQHANLWGGSFTLDLYGAQQQMRYLAENGDDRQDPLIAPLGTLVDQSEIRSKKRGLRTSYAHQDSFGIASLELRGGLDLTGDTADQRLALTNRLWVPPLKYTSSAPWLQGSYDVGPVTLTGGFRKEIGKLHVDSYTTVYYRNRSFVQGGDLDYKSSLPNIGAVWKLPSGWSVFASNSKGFTLPNVGIPLRNVNTPGQSVQGVLDLQAVVVNNKELGGSWRGSMGSFSSSIYESKSKLGTSLTIDPVTKDFILNRVPITIKGFEASGEIIASKNWRVSALYSRILGYSTFTAGGPEDRRLGVNDVNPDKVGFSTTYKFFPFDITVDATKLMSRDINVGVAGSEEHTKGYTLVDLGINYDLVKYGKLSLGVENVANKFYVLSASQVDGYRNYWSGRGRVWSITHNITF